MDLITILCLSLEKIGLGIAGVLGLSFVIAFHELGHFLFCKLFNIHTPSFSIGMGPVLLSCLLYTSCTASSKIRVGCFAATSRATFVF